MGILQVFIYIVLFVTGLHLGFALFKLPLNISLSDTEKELQKPKEFCQSYPKKAFITKIFPVIYILFLFATFISFYWAIKTREVIDFVIAFLTPLYLFIIPSFLIAFFEIFFRVSPIVEAWRGQNMFTYCHTPNGIKIGFTRILINLCLLALVVVSVLYLPLIYLVGNNNQ